MPSKQEIEYKLCGGDGREQCAYAVNDGRFLAESGFVSNTLECHSWEPKSVHFEIDNPWSGSTDTGFGESASISLPAEAAEALARHILNLLGKS